MMVIASEERNGFVFPIEGNHIQVNLSGYSTGKIPEDDAGYLEYAKSLPHTAIYDLMRMSTPVTSVKPFKKSENIWKHFEKVESVCNSRKAPD